QGRIEHAAGIVDDGSSAWLIADAPDAEGLVTWLKRMIFRAQVTVDARPEAVLLGCVGGGAAEKAVRAAASVVWDDPWARVQPGGHQYASTTPHPGAAYDWHVGIAASDDLP